MVYRIKFNLQKPERLNTKYISRGHENNQYRVMQFLSVNILLTLRKMLTFQPIESMKDSTL